MAMTADEISALRQRCRLPQSRVAWECRVPLPNYNRYELGMGKLTAAQLAAVETFLLSKWAEIVDEVRSLEPPKQVAAQ
jgi:hypothetical protein